MTDAQIKKVTKIKLHSNRNVRGTPYGKGSVIDVSGDVNLKGALLACGGEPVSDSEKAVQLDVEPFGGKPKAKKKAAPKPAAESKKED